LKPSQREGAYRGQSVVIPDRPGQTLTHTFSSSAPAGFGIVEHVFLREDEVPVDTAEQQREIMNHHRANLVQNAFLEPRLQTVGRLNTLDLPSLMDLTFDEVWPLLHDLDSVSYMFDSVEAHGQTLRYRDVTFLFSGLGWDQSPDFLIWRLPEVDPGTAWPDVESAAGSAVD
jgi:hypothetical protein